MAAGVALGAALLTPFAHLAAQNVRLADSLLAHGQVARADAEYYAAARTRPRDPETRFALGKYLLSRGALRIGAVLIDEAVQFGYDPQAAGEILSPLYLHLGEYSAAARLAVRSRASDEQALVTWLVTHPSRLVGDSSALVALGDSPGDAYVGSARVRLNGHSVLAMLSPRTDCELRIADTAVVQTLHRFPAAGETGEHATIAAVDSLSMGRTVLTNVPATVNQLPPGVSAEVCYGFLARFAPTIDPRGHLLTLHGSGAAPASSHASSVLPVLEVENQYAVWYGSRWTPIGSHQVATLLRNRRWTFDPRKGQVALEP